MGRNLYNNKDSSTFVPTRFDNVSIDNGDGTFLIGSLSSDTMKIGSIVVTELIDFIESTDYDYTADYDVNYLKFHLKKIKIVFFF